MTRTLAAAAAAFATFACFATTSPAFAQTSTAVKVSDLDLSSPAGQAALDKRLAAAARAVCSQSITGSRLTRIDDACVARAKTSIEHQLAARRASPRNGG